MQDGAHFTATQLVRAGIYNYSKSRSIFVVTLYIVICMILIAKTGGFHTVVLIE
jgi:hypothetical protein